MSELDAETMEGIREIKRLQTVEREAVVLRAEVKRLREALRPFAALGDELPEHMPDDRKLYGYGSAPAFTAGDIRTAHALLYLAPETKP